MNKQDGDAITYLLWGGPKGRTLTDEEMAAFKRWASSRASRGFAWSTKTKACRHRDVTIYSHGRYCRECDSFLPLIPKWWEAASV